MLNTNGIVLWVHAHKPKQLIDFKFYCFNGKPTYMYRTVKALDNNTQVFENFYDMDYNPVGIDHGFPRRKPEFPKSSNYELMQSLAAKISKDVPFLRVDFNEVNGKVYFRECTFYDWAGLRAFKGDWDKKLGELLDINLAKN